MNKTLDTVDTTDTFEDAKYQTIDELIPSIEHHGHMVMSVNGTDYFPEYSYSLGLTLTVDHPEIICFGLPAPVFQAVCDKVFKQIKAGKPIRENRIYTDMLTDTEVRFLPVDPRNLADYFGYAMRLYAGEFTALQMVWQDKQGNFPWQSDFDQNLLFLQPLLDRNADFKFHEKRDLEVYVSRSFIESGQPILTVIHDTDGDWQFLSDDKTDMESIMLVTLEEVITQDSTLNALHYLDYGEMVSRQHVDEIWREQSYQDYMQGS